MCACRRIAELQQHAPSHRDGRRGRLGGLLEERGAASEPVALAVSLEVLPVLPQELLPVPLVVVLVVAGDPLPVLPVVGHLILLDSLAVLGVVALGRHKAFRFVILAPEKNLRLCPQLLRILDDVSLRPPAGFAIRPEEHLEEPSERGPTRHVSHGGGSVRL